MSNIVCINAAKRFQNHYGKIDKNLFTAIHLVLGEMFLYLADCGVANIIYKDIDKDGDECFKIGVESKEKLDVKFTSLLGIFVAHIDYDDLKKQVGNEHIYQLLIQAIVAIGMCVIPSDNYPLFKYLPVVEQESYHFTDDSELAEGLELALMDLLSKIEHTK